MISIRLFRCRFLTVFLGHILPNLFALILRNRVELVMNAAFIISGIGIFSDDNGVSKYYIKIGVATGKNFFAG
jgi:hypothetical protein